MKIMNCDEVIYTYCGDNKQEIIDHMFIQYDTTNRMWYRLTTTAGKNGPFLQLKDTIYRC